MCLSVENPLDNTCYPQSPRKYTYKYIDTCIYAYPGGYEVYVSRRQSLFIQQMLEIAYESS